ncbi:zinc ribbon domain-containing protein [Deinococcus sp. NW-56]|uniref:zinc ribbon domain-containing protein n=1 Tax=Deinococcus sp. NW-56 TaxID=2080419 RepID=UPI000CF3BE7E|nr:zinc ribbon domain-containing protein [Deinococcus sp. NW-56]
MARNDPDLHWVQIRHSSYSRLGPLVQAGALQPYLGRLSGFPGAQIWRVDSPLTVQSDHQCSIAGVPLQAALHHQPSHAYCAMVAASPHFTQYAGTGELSRLLRSHDDWDPGGFAHALEATVRQGRVPLPRPALAVPPTTYLTYWLPERSFVSRLSNGHYMLGLSYTVRYVPPPGLARRSAVGLDLGIDPLTVAHTDTGATRYFRPTSLRHVRQLPWLSADAQMLLRDLIYASGRLDAEGIVAWLNFHAHTVYAERINHMGMSTHWIHSGRDRAIHDHHFSALSQYLFASGVDFRRVAPHHTSTLCAPCFEHQGRVVYGLRAGDRFRCPACGADLDAHANAAHNVLLRGQMLPPRGRAAA